MRESIFVSVIVPVYNGGQGFERCLSGIRHSSYAPYELIVVDNGSADDSVSIAKKHGAKVLYCPGPSGPGSARNMGAQSAQGAVLFFVDADVVIQSDTIDRIAATFRTEVDLDAAFGSYDDAPAETNFLSQYKNLFHHYIHQTASEDASTFWGGLRRHKTQYFLFLGRIR